MVIKNLENKIKLVMIICSLFLVGCIIICISSIWTAKQMVSDAHQKVYVLDGNVPILVQRSTMEETLDVDVHTMYDKDQKEIEDLMMRFFPDYMSDMSQGIYALPEHTELALRNIFTMSAMKNYFYETLPSMANPLGMGSRSIPIAERVQNLLIGDFLNYLALRHQIFLSSMSAIEKKKHKTGQ